MIALLEFVDTALAKRHIQETPLPLAQTAFLHLGVVAISPGGQGFGNFHALLDIKRGHRSLPGTFHKPVQGALENVQNFQNFWNIG